MDGNPVPNFIPTNTFESNRLVNPRRRRQSQTSGTSDEEGEEDDSESSALSHFRKQWEAELKQGTSGAAGHKTNTPTQVSSMNSGGPSFTPTQFSGVSPTNPNSCSPRRQSTSHTPLPHTAPPSTTDKMEEEAKKFFLMGVSFERRGDLYDAVRFYRRAMQLVPDIEHRLQFELREEEAVASESQNEEEDMSDKNENDEEDQDEEDSLYNRFMQRIQASGSVFFRKIREDEKVHLGDFPVEILIYILRWVVSNELDVRSLDSLATVCRGFYCLSRDESLWKMACDRVWKSCDILDSQFSTYREMFLNRPRVRFDGCYISRITYVRPGEQSFQDASYRPWHMVEYFRYIRFYPDGKLLFLTTAEQPGVTVGLLRDVSSRNPTILRGSYHLYGDNVISASVRKVTIPTAPTGGVGRVTKSTKTSPLETVTEFQMDFEIEEVKRKRNWLLRWTYYAVYLNTLRSNNRNNNNEGTGITSTFELTPSKYPPLYFSRVKSFTINSERILE